MKKAATCHSFRGLSGEFSSSISVVSIFFLRVLRNETFFYSQVSHDWRNWIFHAMLLPVMLWFVIFSLHQWPLLPPFWHFHQLEGWLLFLIWQQSLTGNECRADKIKVIFRHPLLLPTTHMHHSIQLPSQSTALLRREKNGCHSTHSSQRRKWVICVIHLLIRKHLTSGVAGNTLQFWSIFTPSFTLNRPLEGLKDGVINLHKLDMICGNYVSWFRWITDYSTQKCE